MRGFTMVAGMNRLHLSGARMTNDQQLKTIAWFGSLPPVLPTEMVGLWQGEGISSGHPLDGVLENLQWFGKRFHADLRADALLFQWQTGRLIALEPSFLPIKLALRLAAVGRTSIARNWFSYMQKACRSGNDGDGRTAETRWRADSGYGLRQPADRRLLQTDL